MFRRMSRNESILNYLMTKGRSSNSLANANYLILYAFLYKYLSDKLKNHLLYLFGADGDDLKTFYMTEEGLADIKEAALNDLGYFIEDYNAYMDQFIGENFVDDYIYPDFINLLKDSIVFSKDNQSKQYFDAVIETLEKQTNFYSYDEEQRLLISNFIVSISKLDIGEEEFSFRKVYDLIIYSRQLRMAPTPEYITQILERTIISYKPDVQRIYDPFMRDASVLFNVSSHFTGSKICAKENNELYYFYSIIKAFIYECDFTDIFFRCEDAVESMSYDDELFDVIASKIPNNFRSDFRNYRNQSLEAPNPNRVDVAEKLKTQFDLQDLEEDEELLEAISVVKKKIEASKKSNVLDFKEEYRPLVNSEFLFVINMINCLKEDGIMAISVSQNFLFKKSLNLLRKFLTHEKNYIDAIISLPETLGRGIRPEVIIVLRKNRHFDDILFIDLTKEFTAVPSKRMVSRRMRGNLILDDATLDKISDVLAKRMPVDKFSEVVDLKELEKNDFNLTVSRYVDTFEGDFIRLEKLLSTKREIDERIVELDKKIDWMMDDLKLR